MQNDWLTLELREICDSIDYGFTQSSTNTPIGPKFLRITDIVSGSIDWGDVPYCEIPEQDIKKYELHDGDIVIARTGATTGYSAYIKKPPKAVFASYLVRYKIKEDYCSKYVSYYLKSKEYWEFIKGVLGDKSAQPNASASTISHVQIKLPPLPVQQKIASILGALDDKIELNRRMNKTLEEIAQAIFRHWFVDNPEAKGWKVGVVGDVLRRIPVGRKYDFKTALPVGKVPILDQSHFSVIGYHNDEPGVIASLENPVIVFSNHRCYTDLIQFSFSAIQNVLPFIGKGVNTRWLYHATDGLITYSEYKGHWPEFISQRLVIPPVEKTNIFGELIAPIHRKTYENNQENQMLTKLRDTLLPKLMRGETYL